jgi:hypothetical protein
MSERNTGILTDSQREYLEAGADFKNYKKRSDLRERIHASLLDGELMFNHLPDEDRERIFDPTQAPHAIYQSAKDGRKDKGEVKNRVDVRMESHELESSIADLVAFVYEGLVKYRSPHDRPFESILQNAMHRVEKRNSWYLKDFDFKAEFDKTGHGERLERFRSGEATKQEAIALLQQGEISEDEFDEFYSEL